MTASPYLTMCSEPHCNQPAVRVGPFERRPLCRRHLLASCRERNRGLGGVSASMQRQLLPNQQMNEQQQHQLHEEQQHQLHEQRQHQLHEKQQHQLHEKQQHQLHEKQQHQLHEKQQHQLHEKQQHQLHEQHKKNKIYEPDRNDMNEQHQQNSAATTQSVIPPRQLPLMHEPSVVKPLPKVSSRSASCAIPLGCLVQWVACCSATDGYLADSTGRVVSAADLPVAADQADHVNALPRPAIYAALQSKSVDHLVVASLDGRAPLLRCYCQAVNLSSQLCGLLCLDQRLFLANRVGVTATDLSGRFVFCVPAWSLFGADDEPSCVRGICSAPDRHLFITDGNRMAGFDTSNGQVQCRFDLSSIEQEEPQQLQQSAVVGPLLLVSPNCSRVLSLCPSTGKLQSVYPRRTTSGFDAFQRATCAAVDSRGHLFVSDSATNAVYAFGGDGSLLQTFGRADPLSSLLIPRGLAIAAGEAVDGDAGCEKLVVADWGHKRLLVFDL